MKSLVIFDLDGTLAESKSAIDDEMAALLAGLLAVVKVAVISGGDLAQFQKQLVANLPQDDRLDNLSLLPTCGTKFLRYAGGAWHELYSEDLSKDQRQKIVAALEPKRLSLRDFAILDVSLADFSVRLGGATSIDVTLPGIDKAYGIEKLREILSQPISAMIYVGDALFPGGNDFPARSTGADCIQVRDPEETKRVIETVTACLKP